MQVQNACKCKPVQMTQMIYGHLHYKNKVVILATCKYLVTTVVGLSLLHKFLSVGKGFIQWELILSKLYYNLPQIVHIL